MNVIREDAATVKIDRADLAYVSRSMTELDDVLVKLEAEVLVLKNFDLTNLRESMNLAQAKILTVRGNLNKLRVHINNSQAGE